VKAWEKQPSDNDEWRVDTLDVEAEILELRTGSIQRRGKWRVTRSAGKDLWRSYKSGSSDRGVSVYFG
jgi:hypothetical protein